MDTDNLVSVVNLPPTRFIGGHTKQGITGKTHGAWDRGISVAMTTTVGVSVYINVNYRVITLFLLW